MSVPLSHRRREGHTPCAYGAEACATPLSVRAIIRGMACLSPYRTYRMSVPLSHLSHVCPLIALIACLSPYRMSVPLSHVERCLIFR